MPSGIGYCWKSIFRIEFLLVYHRHIPSAGQWTQSKGNSIKITDNNYISVEDIFHLVLRFTGCDSVALKAALLASIRLQFGFGTKSWWCGILLFLFCFFFYLCRFGPKWANAHCFVSIASSEWMCTTIESINCFAHSTRWRTHTHTRGRTSGILLENNVMEK